MKGTSVKKRPIVIEKRKTSVSLEDAFWEGINDIAKAQRATVGDTIAKIRGPLRSPNLSSALRLHVLAYYQAQLRSLSNKDDLPLNATAG